MFLLLEDAKKYPGPRGFLLKVTLNYFKDIDCDVLEHSLYDPSNIFIVNVVARGTISSSVPNPCIHKGLEPLRKFPVLGHYPFI